MALFDVVDLKQHYGNEEPEEFLLTFKDYAAKDIPDVFFCEDEHAEIHNIDGKDVLVVLREATLKEHNSHWEAGAKQNFDTGLYTAFSVLYIQVKDYGPKPKVGKQLVIDKKRAYSIKACEEESGIYRMTLERTRQ